MLFTSFLLKRVHWCTFFKILVLAFCEVRWATRRLGRESGGATPQGHPVSKEQGCCDHNWPFPVAWDCCSGKKLANVCEGEPATVLPITNSFIQPSVARGKTEAAKVTRDFVWTARRAASKSEIVVSDCDGKNQDILVIPIAFEDLSPDISGRVWFGKANGKLHLMRLEGRKGEYSECKL